MGATSWGQAWEAAIALGALDFRSAAPPAPSKQGKRRRGHAAWGKERSANIPTLGEPKWLSHSSRIAGTFSDDRAASNRDPRFFLEKRLV